MVSLTIKVYLIKKFYSLYQVVFENFLILYSLANCDKDNNIL